MHHYLTYIPFPSSLAGDTNLSLEIQELFADLTYKLAASPRNISGFQTPTVSSVRKYLN